MARLSLRALVIQGKHRRPMGKSWRACLLVRAALCPCNLLPGHCFCKKRCASTLVTLQHAGPPLRAVHDCTAVVCRVSTNGATQPATETPQCLRCSDGKPRGDGATNAPGVRASSCEEWHRSQVPSCHSASGRRTYGACEIACHDAEPTPPTASPQAPQYARDA